MKSEKGFTLLEVAVAVAILGLSLTVLFGMQSAVVDRIYYEHQRTKGTLYAQYLLSFIDIASKPPAISSEEGPLVDALKKRGYFDNLAGIQEADLAGWTVKTVIQELDGIPDDLKGVLRRCEVSVRWGEAINEAVSLVYVVRVGKVTELKKDQDEQGQQAEDQDPQDQD